MVLLYSRVGGEVAPTTRTWYIYLVHFTGLKNIYYSSSCTRLIHQYIYLVYRTSQTSSATIAVPIDYHLPGMQGIMTCISIRKCQLGKDGAWRAGTSERLAGAPRGRVLYRTQYGWMMDGWTDGWMDGGRVRKSRESREVGTTRRDNSGKHVDHSGTCTRIFGDKLQTWF